jgi:hypothetical protein
VAQTAGPSKAAPAAALISGSVFVKGDEQTEQQKLQKTIMKTDKNSQTTTRSGTLLQPELAVPDTNTSLKIRNCRELRQAIANGCYEFRLLLIGGAYSGKFITTDDRGRRFCVFNYIDDSIQKLTGKELFTKSNIGDAMQNGAFVTEGQSHE